MFSNCPSINTSVHTLVRPISVNELYKNVLRQFLEIWHKCLLGLKDRLIEMWRSKVTVTSQFV